MIIASGTDLHSIKRLGESGRGTWFTPQKNSRNARKKWIAAGLQLAGRVVIDDGALTALQSGKSLLPAGVVNADGDFGRGDTISIVGPNGHSIGRGLVEYDSIDVQRIMGKKSFEIRQILGDGIRTELIHRDNLVMDNNELL